MVVTVRRATRADAPAIRGIRGAAAADLTERCGDGHWSRTPAVATIRTHIGRKAVHVVELDGEPVGCFSLSDTNPGYYGLGWFADPDAPAQYVTDMAIAPAHQRAGIGNWCLARIDELARREGASVIRLDAYRGCAGAGPFYAKYGYAFVRIGTFDLEYYERTLR